MMPVQDRQPLGRHQAQPHKGRQVRSGREIGGLLLHVEKYFLKNIRRVEPALQPAIEAEPDHLLQTIAAGAEQLGGGRGVAGAEAGFKVAQFGHLHIRSRVFRCHVDG